MHVKRIIALLSAALMCLAVLPAAALAEQAARDFPAPEGYDAHDYAALVGFLELEDENGVKNGSRISESYDPADPQTWGATSFLWTLGEGEKQIRLINLPRMGVVGTLDVNGCVSLEQLSCYGTGLTGLGVAGCSKLWRLSCFDDLLTELDVTECPALRDFNCSGNGITELDVTRCPALDTLWCDGNSLAGLDVTRCPALKYLHCSGCGLAELDVTGCPALYTLFCSENSLAELDVSQCPALKYLDCSGNDLAGLDLSGSPNLPLAGAYAEGEGYIGYSRSYYYDAEGNYVDVNLVYAYPAEGAEFTGWYMEGELVSREAEFDFSSLAGDAVLTARFETPAGVLGDADGDGALSANDALAILRYSLGLIAPESICIENCDVNGDGEITANDALLALRAALGLITL